MTNRTNRKANREYERQSALQTISYFQRIQPHLQTIGDAGTQREHIPDRCNQRNSVQVNCHGMAPRESAIYLLELAGVCGDEVCFVVGLLCVTC